MTPPALMSHPRMKWAMISACCASVKRSRCGGGVTVDDGHPAVSPGPAPDGNVSAPYPLPKGLDPQHYGLPPPPPPGPVVHKKTNGSPADQDTWGNINERFDISPGCGQPASPK